MGGVFGELLESGGGEVVGAFLKGVKLPSLRGAGERLVACFRLGAFPGGIFDFSQLLDHSGGVTAREQGVGRSWRVCCCKHSAVDDCLRGFKHRTVLSDRVGKQA